MTEEKWYDASYFSVNDGGVPYSTSARPVSGPESAALNGLSVPRWRTTSSFAR